MRRRDFTAALGAAAMWPHAAAAQSSERVRRVGILLNVAAVRSRDLEVVRELARLGYVEGRNIAYTLRTTDGNADLLPRLAHDLVGVKPEVIIGSTSAVANALAAATRDIPIVMTLIGDPVGLKLTDSLSRPSRNITGYTTSSTSIAAKRLELMRELVPGLRKAGYLWNPLSATLPLFHEQIHKAAEQFGIELVFLPVSSAQDIPAAFEVADREQVAAVLSEADALLVRLSGNIADECLVRNLPGMHAWPFEVRGGALIAYGPATAENYKTASGYVDKLLKGAKVADLPFEEPTQIILAINLRTARQIGLTVPQAILVRADEVIE